jgi:NADH-quinone oxidoreductase subunit L
MLNAPVLILIPLLPLLAFAVIVLWANPNRRLSSGLATGAIAISWLLGWTVAATAFAQHLGYGEEAFHILTNWVPTGSTWLTMGVQVDPLTAIMLFMVPFVCLMIFIYSWGYMGFGTEGVDPRYSRFFAYISLFACGMLGMVVADNYLMLLVFWEIMGLCSYLLIGFWFEKTYPDPGQITPQQAALKAFLVTKVGDLFFLLGILYLYSQTGSLSYDMIFDQKVLHALAEHTVALPLLGTWSVASVIGLLIFAGAVGKSAQFPLHVWLPDAMEGPTPVSALIHAATMVSGGIFLIARIFPLLQVVVNLKGHNPTLDIIAFIGAFTALFASTIAIAQDDIKRVLAYSTISQLGYMIAALGVGAYVAAVFHLITHAFFKALLFLGSGSVIHGMEHGHHTLSDYPSPSQGDAVVSLPNQGNGGEGEFDASDMMNMGGLAKRMPRTLWTFLIGGLALSGVPLVTAGFWSKDKILAYAWEVREIFWVLAVSAGLTAFYTMRQICLTFFGQPRTKAAEHVQESAPSMTVPLIVLSVFAVSLGWVGVAEDFPVIGGQIPNLIHHFVGSTIEPVEAVGQAAQAVREFEVVPLVTGVGFGLGGLFAGWLVYGRRSLTAGQPDPLVKALGPVHTVLKNGYYFDKLYRATVIRGAIALADVLFKFDNHWVIDPVINGVGRGSTALASALFRFVDIPIIDGAVNLAGRGGAALSSALFRFVDIPIIDGAVDLVGRGGVVLATAFFRLVDLPIIDGFVNLVGRVTAWAGRGLRQVQTGQVQNYLLVAFISVLMLLVVYLIR